MKILVATSEAVPFAKTGGLADVCGALPVELERAGHEVHLVMPFYRLTKKAGHEVEATGIRFEVPIGGRIVPGRLLRGKLPESNVPVYFVEQPDYFDREGLYQESGHDYRDNCERFTFFSRAVLELIRLLDLQIDVIHANDWQTGLIPAFLRLEYHHARGYEQIVSLQTIHNLAYQGQFWHWDMLLTGLDWKYFNWRQMEFFGNLNLLKTGIVFADAINTVSPTYAHEIQTPELGCGLDGVLRHRSDVLCGILNGVDYDHWDPATDAYLPANYSVENWKDGKSLCKVQLQERLGLDRDPRVPMIGLVGRLATQKGWDLVMDVMNRWLGNHPAQWAILGTGEPEYHHVLGELAARYPGQVSANLTFDNELAHQIEAGCDIFLMPSRYEPCGLNQMYSLKYGSVPIVRATGGLADTITHATDECVAKGTANGFSFQHYDSRELEVVVQQACSMYAERPEVWTQLVETGMSQDWSWHRSAQEYEQLYRSMQQRQRARFAVAK